MQREFFMDGETLMVAIRTDASNVVTRPATKEEKAAHKPKPKAKK
ncbi:MAG: hypothetical protein ACR2RF_26350 [Geminicoccaceae bacterium]